MIISLNQKPNFSVDQGFFKTPPETLCLYQKGVSHYFNPIL